MSTVDSGSLVGFRLDANLSQDQLAELSGVSKRTIERIESGQQRGARAETVRRLALALSIEPANLEWRSEARCIWMMGSYTSQSKGQRKITDAILPRLAVAFARANVRTVSGDSEMLFDFARRYREAMPVESTCPYPTVIVGRLRDADMRTLFDRCIGAVPEAAILIGGNSYRSRVQEECEAAQQAQIPIIPVAATGGAASRLRTSAMVTPASEWPVLRKTGKAVDAGDLADAIVAATLSVIGTPDKRLQRAVRLAHRR